MFSEEQRLLEALNSSQYLSLAFKNISTVRRTCEFDTYGVKVCAGVCVCMWLM